MKNKSGRKNIFSLTKKLFIPLAIAASSMMLSGCAVVNFFDVSSTMVPPALMEEQILIKNAVEEYLGGDFRWAYLLIDGGYTSILDCDSGEKNYVLVFCKTGSDTSVAHTLLFEKSPGNILLKDDLIEENFDIEKAEIRNISDDDSNSKEITVIGTDLISLRPKVYTYQINADDTLQIKAQKYPEVNA